MSEQDQAFFYQNQKLNRFSVHAKEFVHSFASRNAFALVAVWLLLIAIPLTVKIAQKQQEIRQHAAVQPGALQEDAVDAYNQALDNYNATLNDPNSTYDQQMAAYQAADLAYHAAYNNPVTQNPNPPAVGDHVGVNDGGVPPAAASPTTIPPDTGTSITPAFNASNTPIPTSWDGVQCTWGLSSDGRHCSSTPPYCPYGSPDNVHCYPNPAANPFLHPLPTVTPAGGGTPIPYDCAAQGRGSTCTSGTFNPFTCWCDNSNVPPTTRPTPTPTRAPSGNGGFLCNLFGGEAFCGGGGGGSGGGGATAPPTTASPTQSGGGGGGGGGGSTGTPSPTQTAGSVKLAFSLALQAIGNTGSNTSPTGGSNKNPKHATRTVSVELYDQSGTKVLATQSGQLSYDAASGLFKGTVTIGTIPSGTYSIYVKSDRYLRRRVPGFVTLAPGGTVTVPQATLIAGDINGDNKLDILDYNIISDCYGDKFNSASCQAHAEKNNTDVNDDGVVDGIDYNFFISNLSTSVGD